MHGILHSKKIFEQSTITNENCSNNILIEIYKSLIGYYKFAHNLNCKSTKKKTNKDFKSSLTNNCLENLNTNLCISFVAYAKSCIWNSRILQDIEYSISF
jgi:hypothetical protein